MCNWSFYMNPEYKEKIKNFGTKLLKVCGRAVFVIPNKTDNRVVLAFKVAALTDAIYQEFFKKKECDGKCDEECDSCECDKDVPDKDVPETDWVH